MSKTRGIIDSNPDLKKLHMAITEKIAPVKKVIKENRPVIPISIPSGRDKSIGGNDSFFPSDSKQEKNETADKELARENAARVIQSTWRLSKLAGKFSENRYQAYMGMLHAKDEIQLLAELMYGKVIANPEEVKRFPRSLYASKKLRYHRGDDLDYYTVFKKLAKKVFGFTIETDYGEGKVVEYLPVVSTYSAPLKEMLEKYFPNYHEYLKIHDKGEKIKILEIDVKKIKENERKYGSPELILSKIRALGMIASPWEISILASKNDVMSSYIVKGAPFSGWPSPLPNDLVELNKSAVMHKLHQLSLNNKSPTHLLANSLYALITGLPETDRIDILKRIYVFLNVAMTFYKNNYEKFSLCVYEIVHEISLLLFHENKKKPPVTYNEFKNETIDNAISAFGLSQKNKDEYDLIASPALSGTNAFALSMRLANKMNTPNPTVEVIDPYYYEFQTIYPQSKMKNKLQDIYIISSGPIVLKDGVYPGVDINKFIRKRILKFKEFPAKPITIIIDATSGLYKDLKLDDDLKKYIENGSISIIVNESHQKFGLLHTDQAQYGRVFGICSKKSYSKEVIEEFGRAAEKDLNENLDMMIGAYINAKCGNNLEAIKERHFLNGELFRELLIKFNLLDPKIVKHDLMLTDNNLYFSTFDLENKEEEKAIGALQSIFFNRDSFGHYQTTRSRVLNLARVAPSATDTIDMLIDASGFYLAAKFNEKELSSVLTELNLELLNRTDKLTLQEEIILTGALLSFRNAKITDKILDLSAMIIFLIGSKLLETHGGLLASRFTVQSLQNTHYHYFDVNPISPFLEKSLSTHNSDWNQDKVLLRGILRLAGSGSNLLIHALNSMLKEGKADTKRFYEILPYLGDYSIIIYLTDAKDQNDQKQRDLNIKQYISLLSSYEKMNFYESLNKHASALIPLLGEPIVTYISATCNTSLLADFTKFYQSNESMFTFFSSQSQRSFKEKVHNKNLTSIEEVKSYLNDNPSDATVNKAMEAMKKTISK